MLCIHVCVCVSEVHEKFVYLLVEKSYMVFILLFSQLWSTFGPSEDGVIIEEGFRDSLLRDRLSRYPLMFGVAKAEMLPYISDHDASYGLETEKRREVLKQFVEKFFRFAKKKIRPSLTAPTLFYLTLLLSFFVSSS